MPLLLSDYCDLGAHAVFYANEIFHAGRLHVGPDGRCDHLYVWVHRHTGTHAATATVYVARHFQRGRSGRTGVDYLDLAEAAPENGDDLSNDHTNVSKLASAWETLHEPCSLNFERGNTGRRSLFPTVECAPNDSGDWPLQAGFPVRV
jgi:hypothetical protein